MGQRRYDIANCTQKHPGWTKKLKQQCRFCRRLTPYIVEFTSLGLHCKRTASLSKGRAFQQCEKPDRWPVRGQAPLGQNPAIPRQKLRRIFSNLAKYSKQIKGNNTVVKPIFALLHPEMPTKYTKCSVAWEALYEKSLTITNVHQVPKNLHTEAFMER